MTLYHDHLKYVRECTDRALAETGFDHVVIAAGALHVAFLDDNTYPFRPNPHFKWWLPVVDNPNCLIVYTPGQTPRQIRQHTGRRVCPRRDASRPQGQARRTLNQAGDCNRPVQGA